MSGRYAFSLPEPRQRDGWFRIGSVDVTTTTLIIGLGLASMVLYALSPEWCFKGAFWSELVRDGEVWRVATWPITNPPVSIWALISLAIFWWLGHMVEDEVGRVPFTVIVLAMTIIPAVIVSLININNDLVNPGRWSAYTYSVSLLSLGMITIFGLERPNARFWPGIPAWVIAAAIVFIEVLSDLGNRQFAQLILVLLVIAVGCIGARQRGMLDILTFIPRIAKLGPSSTYAYGEVRQAKPKRKRGPGSKKGTSAASSPTVVAGPWGAPSGGLSPLEQAELDVLLDRISSTGIDSLTGLEKARLQELSKRMRGS